jgi:hypothetical protein
MGDAGSGEGVGGGPDPEDRMSAATPGKSHHRTRISLRSSGLRIALIGLAHGGNRKFALAE